MRWCWAKVTETVPANESLPKISVTVFIEALKGNRLERFERYSAVPASVRRWANLAAEAQGKQLYYLNVSESPVVPRSVRLQTRRLAAQR